MKTKILKLFKLFVLSILIIGGFSGITVSKTYAQDLVTNRTNFWFWNEDGEKIGWEHFKGKFTLFWFYDDYCPFTIRSMPELMKVLAYINYYYSDYVNFVFVEALNRPWQDIDYFRNKFHLEDYEFFKSPGMNTNNYLNVDRTPTLIIMDPYGNIVDKVTGKTIAIIYIRHLDIILGRYFQANDITDYDPKELINEDAETIFNKLKEALKAAGWNIPN